MLLVLLRQRLRLFWNSLTRGPRRVRRIIGALIATVFTLGFVVFAGSNAGGLVDRLSRTDAQAAADALPLLLIAVTLLTLLTSLSSAFHHLFLAGDMELLLASPVTARALFWLKIVEIWRDSAHVLIFQGAALYAYGAALRMPPLYYVLAALVSVSLTLGATAVGATVTLAMARVRFGDSILGLSRLVAMLLFLPIGILGVPALGFGRAGSAFVLGQDNIQALASGLRSVGPPPSWAPTTWAAHLLLGDEVSGLSAALLAAVGVLVFASTQLAYDGLFQGGWERVRFAGPRARRQRARRGLGVTLPRVLPASPVIGILEKDWRTLLRDPRWRTGTVLGLVALAVPAVLLFVGDPFARAAPWQRFWFGMLPVPYLAYLVGSQQGAATLAYEGRNIALLRAAPLGMGRVMLAKMLGGLVLVMVVTWMATLALAVRHGGDVVETALALVAGTWLALGATLAAVAGAALTVDFEGDNPQRRVGCLGTIVTSALSLFFFSTNTLLLVWWVARSAFLNLPRVMLPLLPIVDWLLPGLALLSVSLLVLASRYGLRRVAGWEGN